MFNGVVLPDGSRVEFKKLKNSLDSVTVREDGLFATRTLPADTIIGTYAGEIKVLKSAADWNPYQMTPDESKNYCVDSSKVYNYLRYINDSLAREPNAVYYRSNSKIGEYYMCHLFTTREIAANEEILVSYGNNYWEMCSKYYTCTECKFVATSSNEMNAHLDTAHCIVGKNCNDCNQEFADAFEMVKHAMSAHSINSVKFCCTKCNFMSAFIDAIQYHKRRDHITFKCTDCNSAFDTHAKFTEHAQLKHGEVVIRAATIAPVEVSRPIPVKIPIPRSFVLQHAQPNPPAHKCDECGLGFDLITKLSSHITTTHGVNIHKCEICNRNFLQKSTMELHRRSKHGNNYKCNKCSLPLNSARNLALHMKTHEKRDYDADSEEILPKKSRKSSDEEWIK
jgi:hypothetical protein